ncbi:MAG: hypothetical protein HY939_06105 [Gammaproteobacteria bacterium]|nr:hypothetical protein [Gammaproteobacteria bacterium]
MHFSSQERLRKLELRIDNQLKGREPTAVDLEKPLKDLIDQYSREVKYYNVCHESLYLNKYGTAEDRVRTMSFNSIFRRLSTIDSFSKRMDCFPNYPMAKSNDQKVAVQDPTTPSTFYMRLYKHVLLKVEHYGSATEKYETLFFDEERCTIRTRKQCESYETPLFKKAIQGFLEAQAGRVIDPEPSNRGQSPISRSMGNLFKFEVLPLDKTPADPYGPGAIVLYKNS